jgi:hypothetical protein
MEDERILVGYAPDQQSNKISAVPLGFTLWLGSARVGMSKNAKGCFFIALLHTDAIPPALL